MNFKKQDVMNAFFDTLTSKIDKVLYKSAYEFELEYCNGTPETAHEAGVNKLIQVGKLAAEMAKPQTYIDLSTGKKFTSTENDLMARYA